MGKHIIKPIYVDLRRDYAAKTIFGKKGNEDLLLLLLKAILPEKQISQIYFTNSEHKGLREDSRGAVFDIECETDSGEDITIEVQFKSQDDFGDRMIFYSTFPVQNGVIREHKDGSYSLRYGFPKVYVIAINNFIMPIEPHDDDVITEYAVTSVKNSERYLSQDVRFVTVELP